MRARQRTAFILIVLALACFIARWPLDNYLCDPNKWHGQEKDAQGKFILWREPEKTGSGKDLFSEVLSGGAGTPAMFALLGGQRYLVANILWNYADVLFHKGDSYRMVSAFDSCVSLNPNFAEAWSTYGWHEAWNLFDDAQTITEKEKWLDMGIDVYQRAIEAQPKKPHPHFDMGWLYLERVGDYFQARDEFAKVVEGTVNPTTGVLEQQYTPLTGEERRKIGDGFDTYTERRWDPNLYAMRLGHVYKMLGVVTEDKQYFMKAIATYQKCLDLDPIDTLVISDGTHTAHYLVTATGTGSITATYAAQPGDSASGSLAQGAKVAVSAPTGRAAQTTTTAALTIADGSVTIKVADASAFTAGCQDAARLKKEIANNMNNPSWLKTQQDMETALRRNFQMLPLHYGGRTMDELYNGKNAGQNTVVTPM